MKLIIAEKPSAAADIARVIGASKVHDVGGGIRYHEGNGVIVASARGHLIELADPDYYGEQWVKWTLEALPCLPETMALVPNQDGGKRLDLLKKLIGEADEVIEATDAGREGELIFRYIWEYCGGRCKVSRFWPQSMTDESIAKAMQDLRPLSDFDTLAAAAAARSEADWMIGMNGTRAYTKAFSSQGVLSIGRVQTPVLGLIVARDLAIEGFRSTPFWEMAANYRGGKFKRSAGRFEKRDEADGLLESLKGSDLVVTNVTESEKREKAPALYDLTEIQRDGNRVRKLEAKRTLEIVQGLYERKHVTYPRTDSRYLSTDMVADAAKAMDVAKAVIGDSPTVEITGSHRSFNDKKVSDHHAIIPTLVRPEKFESDDERWIYEAICRRLIAAFSHDCRKAATVVLATVGSEDFKASGTVTIEEGWRGLYSQDVDDAEPEEVLPKYSEGESGSCEIEIVEGKTTPPKAYTEATLLTAMEQAGREVDDEELKEALKERGLGTPATRAAIIETLVARQYVGKEKGKVLSTDRGRALIAAITDPILKSPELTGDWEHKLRRIERGEISAAGFLSEVKSLVVVIVDSVRSAGSNEGLAQATSRKSLGECPVCKKHVNEFAKGWSCTDRECKFVVWKVMCKKNIPESAVEDLLKKGKSAVLKGFVSSKETRFDAMLVWKGDEAKVGFEFPPKDSKPKTKRR